MNARTIRERAWNKLGEGNWLRAVLAYLLFWLAGMVISSLLTQIGVRTGGIEATTLGKYIMAKHGIDIPPELPAMLRDMPMNITTPGFRVCSAIVSNFMAGVLQAGWALFAVAMMRNGAHVMQVFSGFGRFLSTGWLMLLQSFFVALWSLLLVIPGIVAFYSYRLSFFLKADHPDWSACKLLSESKRMMKGHKWRLACLDASFIGWILLCLATFGAGFVFISPYMNVANAAFYEDLLDRPTGAPTPFDDLQEGA